MRKTAFVLLNIKLHVSSSQADEPISDYAAMDDVYQGKLFQRSPLTVLKFEQNSRHFLTLACLLVFQ